MTVLTATNIVRALRLLKENEVDVVLADMKLGKPGEADGGDLLEAVERWHSGVGRILFSADPSGVELARSIGATWYDKDHDISELVGLIRKVAYRG